MTLEELLTACPAPVGHGVPGWMLGFWKRYSISFADGRTDLKTHVCWLQSRNFTIDLRLPRMPEQVVEAKPWQAYTAGELAVLADNEGWLAPSAWDGRMLQWHEPEASLQLHNRWPEPAVLQRVGNCMVEFGPSGAYVEDWRLQPSAPGPLVGLRLVDERSEDGGGVRHRGGGLIVCGDYAAMVLGRATSVGGAGSLKARVLAAEGQPATLAALLGFETSVAVGSLARGYAVTLSSRAGRMGQPLFIDGGFELGPEGPDGTPTVVQRYADESGGWVRRFVVDALEPRLDFAQGTPWQDEARAWYEREAATLGRYLQALY